MQSLYSLKCRLLFSVAMVALLPVSAEAADYTVDTVVTDTNGGHTLNGNDSLTITEAGAINADAGDAGVESINNDNITITNNGAIKTSGNHAIAILGNNIRVTNKGVISVLGINRNYGILVGGNNNVVINSGTIDMSGQNGHAIIVDENGAFYKGTVVTNNGTIKTSGLNGFGILAGGGSNTITNSGTITTSGDLGVGILAGISSAGPGSGDMIKNSGTIRTTGEDAYGIGIGLSVPGSNAVVIDGNTIRNSGTIETLGNTSIGLYINSSANTITNSGKIITSGDSSYAIFINRDNNTLVNSGTITTSGRSAVGMRVFSNNNTLTNGGTIATSGELASGILINGQGNTLTHSGQITTSGSNAYGVFSFSDTNTITNSGTVMTSGQGAVGLNINGNTNILANSGTVMTSGADAHGIFVFGNTNTLTNDGSVMVSGADAVGILANGNDNTLTNGGRVVSEQSDAIRFVGSNNTLTLKSSSFLRGGLNLGTDATLNIMTGPGQSVLWDFSATPNLTADQVHVSGPSFGVYNGDTKQFASIDPTYFDGDTDRLASFSRAISNLAEMRLTRLRTLTLPSSGSSAHGSVYGDEAISSNGDGGLFSSKNIWASGFGSYSSYDNKGMMLDNEVTYYGFAIGFDALLHNNMQVGIMVGYGHGTPEVKSRFSYSYKDNTDEWFAAFYGRKHFGRFFVDLIVPAGLSQDAEKRYINDNTVAGGIATASADYDSYWVAPEIAFGVDFAVGPDGWVLTPNARLRYALRHVDGYSEKGPSAANATIGDHDVSLLEGRVGVQVAKLLRNGTLLEFGLGWQHREPFGDDDVPVTLVGKRFAMPIDSETRDMVYVNGDVTLPLSDRIALSLFGEAAIGEKATDLTGNAAIEFSF